MDSLSDLFVEYVGQTDPTVQTSMTSMGELDRLRTDASEDPPSRGEFYYHQQVVGILMKEFDDMLLMHEPGTGKSCATTLVAESLKSHMMNVKKTPKLQVYDPKTGQSFEEPDDQHNNVIDHVYIIVKGASLKREFKQQIVCKCTDGEYETSSVRKATNERNQKKAVTMALKKFYTFWTYRRLGKELKTLTDEEIIENYSNSLFIIDEVHNLRPTGNTESDSYELKEQYEQIYRIFHLVQRSKRIIMSATPMIDSVNEIGVIMNLILPESMRMDGIDFKTATKEQLEPYFRGRISYVRALDTGAVPYYEGKLIDSVIDGKNSQSVVYGVTMSSFQSEGYYKAEGKGETDVDPFTQPSTTGDVSKLNAFHQEGRQASIITYPVWNGTSLDPESGSVGFNSVIAKDEHDRYKVKPEYLKYFSDLGQVRVMSAKGAAVVEIIQKTPGVIYVFSTFVSGSGAVGLSKIVEHTLGLEEFDFDGPVFTPTDKTRTVRSFCSSDDVSSRTINIPKKYRYALFTHDTPQPKVDKIFEILNSPENVNGEYIKVIIASNVARDGVNIKHVRATIIMGPEWNPSPMVQAEGRGIRATSHVELLKMLQLTKIDVPIYRMSAVAENGHSIDNEMYLVSESKERDIKRIVRIMKMCSVDCQLHKKRNQRESDVEGSVVCDYDECAYECFSPSPDALNNSNLHAIDSDKNVLEIKKQIVKFFKVNFSTTIEELFDILGPHTPENVHIAIDELVRSGTHVVNRFGYISFIKESEGVIFLTRINDSHKGDTEYSDKIFSTESLGIDAESSGITKQIGLKHVMEILQMNADDQRFIIKLDEFAGRNVDMLTSIVESAIAQHMTGRGNRATEVILNRYRNDIFYIPHGDENDANLQKAISIVEAPMETRGRKAKDPNKPKDFSNKFIENYTPPSTDTGSYIVFHTIFNLKSTSHNTAVSFAKIIASSGPVRIYMGGEWRNAFSEELITYHSHYKFVRRMIEDNLSKQTGIFGSILQDGKFRIHDNTNPAASASGSERKRGGDCATYNMEVIKRFEGILGIGHSRTRKESCEAIRNRMDQLGIIYRTFN